jgi:hypothetical protein
MKKIQNNKLFWLTKIVSVQQHNILEHPDAHCVSDWGIIIMTGLSGLLLVVPTPPATRKPICSPNFSFMGGELAAKKVKN